MLRVIRQWRIDFRGVASKPVLKVFLSIFGAASLIFTAQGAGAGQRHVLRNHIPAAARAVAPVGVLPPETQLDLTFGLPLRDEAGLNQFLEELYDPQSPRYHRYLSPQEFADKFGPSEDDYQALVQYAQTNGLVVVGKHPNRLILDVRGTVGDIERVLATQLRVYPHPRENRRFYAPATEPSVRADIPVLDVSGLDNYLLPRPMSLRRAPSVSGATPQAGSATGGSYRGNDFRAAYLPGVARSGIGQSVGLIEFDGYYSSDIAEYVSQSGIAGVPVQNILLNGFSGTPGVNNAEAAMDIEVTMAMAPGLSSILVYEGNSPNTILNRMANDNRAKQLSSSWTFGINATTENIFRQFASQGQSMFQASGDDGAYLGVIPTPADDPNVTVVGGTTLFTSGPSSDWSSETTWNWASTGSGSNGSGGGVSASYPIPSYQKGLDMSANQGSTTSRNIPDVSLTADNIWVVYDNGSKGVFGGTSASTPLWAGLMALINEQALANGKPTMGFVNAALYTIAKSANYGQCFHDITTGNNFSSSSPAKYTAVPGYDLCTGLGTPAGQPLINALAGGNSLPPVFQSDPFTVAPANAAQPYSNSIASQVSAASGETLAFSKLGGPAWLTVSPAGILGGTPGSGNVGTNVFQVMVTESSGMSNTASMYLEVNGPPQFTSPSISGKAAMCGQAYSDSLASRATDPNPGDTLTFSKISGPAWLNVSSAGTLSGTPGLSDAGTNQFVVGVADSLGLSSSAALYIDINGPPAFAANPFIGPSTTVGQSYSGTISNYVSDPNPNTQLTFSKAAGPAWLRVAPDGTLSGTPSANDIGTNSFTVMVVDSGGLTSSAVMHIAVAPAAVLQLLISTSGNLISFNWTGGTPPFQVQAATNLSLPQWRDISGPLTNRSFSVIATTPAAVYRLQGAAP